MPLRIIGRGIDHQCVELTPLHLAQPLVVQRKPDLLQVDRTRESQMRSLELADHDCLRDSLPVRCDDALLEGFIQPPGLGVLTTGRVNEGLHLCRVSGEQQTLAEPRGTTDASGGRRIEANATDLLKGGP